MAEMTDDPAAYWNERAGHGWVRAQAMVDHMLSPIDARLLEVAAPTLGERVVEIGSGGGSTSMALARAVGPEGSVLGVDVSAPMVDHARARCHELPQLTFEVADAATYPFAPLEADLVTSRFGVMFFPDPTSAFDNIRRALCPAGRLAMATWQPADRNGWASWILQAFPEAEPQMPDAEAGPGPFSLSDPDRIREILERAGWSDVRIEARALEISPGADVEQALAGLADVGPLARFLSQADDDQRPALLERAREFLERQYAASPPTLPAAIWLTHARP